MKILPQATNPEFNGFALPQVDHDVCSNYGNWLYSAGLGNDPRENRKFNMIKQGLDYDADVSCVWSMSPH